MIDRPLIPDDLLVEAIAATSGCTIEAARREALPLLAYLTDAGAHIAYDLALPTEAHARTGDPEASKLAAMSIIDMPDRFTAVLRVANRYWKPWTYDDLCELYPYRMTVDGLPKQTDQSVRSRAARLRDAGYIDKVDDDGVSENGRRCQRWTLSDRGRAMAAAA